jgi:cytochrome c2
LIAILLGLASGCGAASRGHTAQEIIASELTADVAHWVSAERLPPKAVHGARLFAISGCTACHVYLASGSSALSAPSLTREGSRGRGLAWQVRHLRCPACVVPGSQMPNFGSLGSERLRQLAIFLEASKGKQ